MKALEKPHAPGPSFATKLPTRMTENTVSIMDTITNTIHDIAFELVHGEDAQLMRWDAEALLTGAGIVPTALRRAELDQAVAVYLAELHQGWTTDLLT